MCMYVYVYIICIEIKKQNTKTRKKVNIIYNMNQFTLWVLPRTLLQRKSLGTGEYTYFCALPPDLKIIKMTVFLAGAILFFFFFLGHTVTF